MLHLSGHDRPVDRGDCETQVGLYILTASAMVENTDDHRSRVFIGAHNITLDHELSRTFKQRSSNPNRATAQT